MEGGGDDKWREKETNEGRRQHEGTTPHLRSLVAMNVLASGAPSSRIATCCIRFAPTYVSQQNRPRTAQSHADHRVSFLSDALGSKSALPTGMMTAAGPYWSARRVRLLRTSFVSWTPSMYPATATALKSERERPSTLLAVRACASSSAAGAPTVTTLPMVMATTVGASIGGRGLPRTKRLARATVIGAVIDMSWTHRASTRRDAQSRVSCLAIMSATIPPAAMIARISALE